MGNLTDNIYRLTAPYDNPWQGDQKRLLFVCSAGLLRSATGATVYSKKGYNTRTCGTHDYALIPLSANLIAWAHKIVFVNEENYRQALTNFSESWLKRKSVILNISDDYEYMNEHLIALLEKEEHNILAGI